LILQVGNAVFDGWLQDDHTIAASESVGGFAIGIRVICPLAGIDPVPEFML
jgi:hypothetical protein